MIDAMDILLNQKPFQFPDSDTTMVQLERVLHRHVLRLLARNVVIDREVLIL